MIGIDLTSGGAIDLLDGVLGRLEQPEPGLQHLAGLLSTWQEEVFATGGNGTWPPLDDDTVRIKGSRRVLVDTGGLFDALTNIRVIDPETVGVTDVPAYGQYVKRRRDPTPPPAQHEIQQWGAALLGWIVEGRV